MFFLLAEHWWRAVAVWSWTVGTDPTGSPSFTTATPSRQKFYSKMSSNPSRSMRSKYVRYISTYKETPDCTLKLFPLFLRNLNTRLFCPWKTTAPWPSKDSWPITWSPSWGTLWSQSLWARRCPPPSPHLRFVILLSRLTLRKKIHFITSTLSINILLNQYKGTVTPLVNCYVRFLLSLQTSLFMSGKHTTTT